MARRRDPEIDPYSPPSRMAEGPVVEDDPESEDPVITALRKGSAPALALSVLSALGALLFGGCAAFILSKESSVGSGLYFAGLAFGCGLVALFLGRLWQKLRDLGLVRTKQKVLEVVEAQNSALRAAALAVVLVVLVTGVMVLVLLSSTPWD